MPRSTTDDRELLYPNAPRRATRLFGLLMALVAFGSPVHAQESLSASVTYKPGDIVHLIVAFKNGGVPIQDGWARFELTGDVQPGQQPFSRVLDVNHLVKLSDNEWEFSGSVSETLASGEYQLRMIIGNAMGLSRRYDLGKDFQSKITVRVLNPKHVTFPDIKEVSLKSAGVSGGASLSGGATVSGSAIVK